ncbi:phosphoglycerate mutase family protein [Xylariales sp. PMI_506]|nr:phosphoglycerate mutase family protein [Xylariales sp. PMI_506]
MSTPRVFIVRHGETEWSLSGKHTGITDIPLTANGEKRVKATGRALVGSDRLIVPQHLAHVYVSPRKRAQRTFELLNLGIQDPLPWKEHGERPEEAQEGCSARVEITEDIREWDYGNYEGITSAEIRDQREGQGLNRDWDIWRDGCVGGELSSPINGASLASRPWPHGAAPIPNPGRRLGNPGDVTARVDRLIEEIRNRWHAPTIGKPKAEAPHGDVLVVAHGHILRAFAMRWVGKTLQDGPAFLMEAGGVGILSYEHHSIEEPAILLGGAFYVE